MSHWSLRGQQRVRKRRRSVKDLSGQSWGRRPSAEGVLPRPRPEGQESRRQSLAGPAATSEPPQA